MKHDTVYYTCRTEFNENAVRLMFKTEYFAYEKKLLLMRCAFAVVLLGVGVFSKLAMPARMLCLLVGVWLLVAMDFPSKVRAEGVIQSLKGKTSQVNLIFSDREIQVEQRQTIPYAKVDRLVEDDAYFCIFQNKQTAVMVAKAGLEPADPEAFRAFIEGKTGKAFRRNVNILSMNLFDLLGSASAKGKKRKRK
ncbi:MAG: YcxB family protein [Candidatus Ventricola sp.]